MASSTSYSVARSGVALVLVLGLLVVVFTFVAVASQFATAGTRAATDIDRGSLALQAVTAVLMRRERDVTRLGEAGEAARFTNWDSATVYGHQNYGIDYVGNCEVRWKVEPARTPPEAMDNGGVLQNADYIVDPSPKPDYVPTDLHEKANSNTYMYRISAEARMTKGAALSRAQGVRFAAISRSPLFRYAIYYVQSGPRGDLELSHADGVNIKGSVYSNGSIYLGGGLKVNDTLLQRGSIDASLNPSGTIIGPDAAGLPVAIRGYDGIFRMSKPLLFGVINGLPLTATPGGLAGTPVGSFVADATTYDITSTVFPLETTAASGSTPLTATLNGTLINPYRVKDSSGVITFGPTTTAIGFPTGSDNFRVLNGNALLGGSNPASGNDSRDATRSGSLKWSTLAASVFGNHPATRLSSMVKDTLYSTMINRPLEAQMLRQVEVDGDTTTVDHEYARPLFVKAADGSEDLNLPQDGTRAIEASAAQLSNAMGEGNYMVRKLDGSGWDIRKRTDFSSTISSLPDNVGLIIRERPIPDTGYWPGGNPVEVVPVGSPRYLPYAYGKHWYPAIEPFTIADVSDNLLPSYKLDGAQPAVRGNISTTQGYVTYLGGGQLMVSAAANPGPSAVSSGTRNGTWNNYGGNLYNGMDNKQYYFRDPWKFVHLNKIRSAAVPVTGQMTLVCYQDPFARDEATGIDASLPFSGNQLARGDVSVANGQLVFLTTPSPATFAATMNWSCRWMGQLAPTATGSYLLSLGSVNANHRVRVWVGSNIAVESGVTSATSQSLSLVGGKLYPLVIELAQATPGPYAGVAPALRWSMNGAAAVAVPTASILLPSGMVGFPSANFNYVECRIDNPRNVVGPNALKAGLMIRPDSVASPLLQGGSPYAMVGWSPSRGFFTQRRQVASTQDLRTFGLYFVGNGVGADALGQVAGLSGARSGTLQQVYLSTIQSRTSYTTNSGQLISYSQTPAVTINPGSVTTGGGVQWELLDAFTVGIYKGALQYTPTKYRSDQKYLLQTIQLGSSIANFINADDSKQLTIYSVTPPPTNSLTTLIGALSVGYRSAARVWCFSNATGVYDNSTTATAINRSNLTREWAGGWSNGATVTGSTVVGPTATLGSSTTAWRTAGQIRVRKNGLTTSTNSASDIQGYLTAIGSPYSVTTTSATPSAGNFTPPTLTYPLDGSCAAGTAPGNPSYTDLTTARTFSLSRSNSQQYIDGNSWTTGTGTWFAAPQFNYLPYGPSWPAAWTNVLAWPTTLSFRPDVWGSATAPTYGLGGNLVANSRIRAATTVTAAGTVTGGDGYSMNDDVQPAGWNAATTSEVWMRAVKTANSITFYGYVGTARPNPSTFPAGWTVIGNPVSIASWNTNLLVGPCVQSGSSGSVCTALFTDLKVGGNWVVPSTPDVTGDNLLDSNDWDRQVGGADNLALYLMSQYQVFLGPLEITEDFFLYRNAAGLPTASEDWFFNTREFWSQPRWWDHLTKTAPTNQAAVSVGANYRLEKDPFLPLATTFSSVTNRMLLCKTTVLSLNMDVVQSYISTRTLNQAQSDVITSAGGAIATLTNGADLVSRHFNGLIYAARTNRYPWNPNSNAGLGSTTTGTNPYSASEALLLPNSMPAATSEPAALVNGDRYGSSAHGLETIAATYLGVSKLQPYPLDQAPAFKPQQFIHGIRLQNAENINWNHGGGATTTGTLTSSYGKQWTYAVAPAFGASATSIVTPNALYVRGGLNVDEHQVIYNNAPTFKSTPLAIMGDSITFQSRAWKDVDYQRSGLVATNTTVSSGGVLVAGNTLPVALSTYYRAGIVTNNLPTTKARIIEGQGAPFVDTVQFLENWSGTTMGYVGSLVVLDERRYTKSFLLDVPKNYGTTPFGVTLIANPAWSAFFGNPSVADQWSGASPIIYREPTRTYDFNDDFRINVGTPPFVPFGVTSKGLGGWARIVE